MLNYSQASENNKQAILSLLHDILADTVDVLEIGSGSGQHALFFSQHLPNLNWQATELSDGITALEENIKQYAPDNVLKPVELDVCKHPWNVSKSAAIYTANTLHIMPWASVAEFFIGVGKNLNPQGLLCIYGPFKYKGEFTTQSNADFDQWLKRSNPMSGIRDFEKISELALGQGMSLVNDFPMPANNQLIIFKRN